MIDAPGYDQLFAAGQAAMQAGRADVALDLFRQARGVRPRDPKALNAIGNRLISLGRPGEAREVLEAAIAVDSGIAPIWLNLAIAARADGDGDAELAALDGSLRADPYFGMALLHKAGLMEQRGQRDAAAALYQALLNSAPPAEQLPDGMRRALDHARQVVAAEKRTLFDRFRSGAAATGVRSERFDRSIELYCGLAERDSPAPVGGGSDRRHRPAPTGLYFPALPEPCFFDPALMPWLAELEAATDRIRAELLAVIARDMPMRPYVDIPAERPVNQWAELNRSLDWSALFLWENGKRIDANADACPATDALVRKLPLLDIPGKAPTAMFSILRPGAVIPPHHGVTNSRAVVHLPLVIPPDCGFRVGGETREWREGTAWAFDDTIEHEAWNRTDQPRAILILDAWNPYLTADERTLVAQAMLLIDQPFGG